MSDELPLEPWEKGVHRGIEWAIVYAPMFAHFNAYCWIPAGANIRLGELMVTGGITYGYSDDDSDDYPVANSMWVGFDTAHGQDTWSIPYLRGLGIEVDPETAAMKERMHAMLSEIGGFPVHTWTLEELRQEVQSLADQIIDQIKRQAN